MVFQNPSTWSKHLVWVEYAHNSLPTSATGFLPFHGVYGYQPPVFPDNELEVSFPSAHAMIRRFRRIWIAARQVLIRQGDRVKRAADRRRRPAPDYQPGQRVWSSAKDLHLKVPSKKLAPRFVGPFPVTRKVGPAAVRLRLPRSLRVHPTFHISQGKPVRESPMVPGMQTIGPTPAPNKKPKKKLKHQRLTAGMPKCSKKLRYSVLTPKFRAEQYPKHFYQSGDQLFCRVCQHAIYWKRKDTCDDHLMSKIHIKNNERRSQGTPLQTTI